jgi:hypothetical protein
MAFETDFGFERNRWLTSEKKAERLERVS